MRTLRACVARDLRVAWSYRLSFFTQYGSVLFTLLSTRFVAQLFEGNVPESLRPYGDDYFSFALLGVGLSLLTYPALKTFAAAVRGAQVTGTLEAMLITRANPLTVIVGSGLYPTISVVLQFLLLVVLGGTVMGAHYRLANLGLLLVVLSLAVLALAGIGLISAAFVLAFRENEPFTGVLVMLSLLLSGTIYPTSVLPHWLRWIAVLLPTTHAIEVMRGVFLSQAQLSALFVHVVALVLSAMLFPAGLLVLSWALRYARRTGSLAQY